MNSFKNFLTAAALIFSFTVFAFSEEHHNHAPFFGFAINDYPVTERILHKLENETKIYPRMINFFLQWPSKENIRKAEFPLETLENISKISAAPCMTWEPMYIENGKEIAISYSQILNHRYDSYILRFAREIKLWGKPLLIRFAHEMNSNRYHWGIEEEIYTTENPEIYKKFFQHVVSLFRKEGVHNVLWVFCPNSESIPDDPSNPKVSWNKIENYYPGDHVVDILGIDGYNRGKIQTRENNKSQWKSFKEIFYAPYKILSELSPGKPIIIFETSTVSEGGDKLLWIKESLETAKNWGIKGIIWFQDKKDYDWRINYEVKNSYIEMVRKGTSSSHPWIEKIPDE